MATVMWALLALSATAERGAANMRTDADRSWYVRPDGSLVQLSAQELVGCAACVPMNAMESANKEAQGKGTENSKIFQQLMSSMQKNTNTVLDNAGGIQSDVETASQKSAGQMQKFTRGATGDAQKISQTATNDLAKIGAADANAQMTSEDIMSGMGTFTEEGESNTDENLDKVLNTADGDAETLADATTSLEEGLAGEGEEMADEANDEAGELVGNIEENGQKFEEDADEDEDAIKEVNTQLKVGDKLNQQMVKSSDKTLEKLKQNTAKTGTEITQMATGSLKTVEQMGKTLDSNIAGEVTQATKDLDNELKEVDKSVKDKQTEQQNALKDIEKQAVADRNELSTEAGQVFSANDKLLEKYSGSLEKNAETQEEMLEQAKDDADDTKTAVANTNSVLSGDLRDAGTSFSAARQVLTQEVGNDLDKAKEDVGQQVAVQSHEVETRNKAMLDGIKSVITKSGNDVENVVNELEVELSDMEDGIQENSNTVNRMNGAIEGTKSKITQQEGATLDAIGETSTKAVESINEYGNYVKNSIAQTNDDVVKEAAVGKELTAEELDAAKVHNSQVIQSFAGDSQKVLDGADRSIQLAQTKEKDELMSTQAVAKEVAGEKAFIENEIPKSVTAIQKSYQDTKDEIAGANQQLHAATEKVQTEITAESEELNKNMGAEVTNLDDATRTQVTQAAEKMQKSMDTLSKEIEELKEGQSADYKTAEQSIADLNAGAVETLKGSKNLHSKAEANKQELQSEIATEEQKLQSVDRAEHSKTAGSEAQMQNLMTQRINGDFAPKAQAEVDAVMSEQKEHIKDFVTQQEHQLNKNKGEMEQFMAEEDDELSKTEQDVKEVSSELEQQELAAHAKNEKLVDATNNLESEQERLEKKGEEDFEQQTAQIHDRTAQLGKTLASEVKGMGQSEEENLQMVQSQTQSAIKQQQDRQDGNVAKMKAGVDNWNQRTDAAIQKMENEVGKVDAEMKSFESETAKAENGFQQGSVELSTGIEMADDKVSGEIRNADRKVAGSMNSELDNMDELVGQLKSTEGTVTNDVGKMEENMNDELQYFAQQGKEQGNRLSQELNHLEDGSIDLVKQFQLDTEPSQSELSNAEERLGSVVKSSKDQMATLGARLVEIKKSREGESVKLHNSISDAQGEMTGVMGDTVNLIEQMRNDANKEYMKMQDEQKDFQRMLAEASTITSSHSDGHMNQVSSQMSKLEMHHKRLVDWQKHHKHYSIAWRAEVENQMKRLNGDIDAGQDDVEAGRLRQEMQTQDQMRNMQGSVERKVVDASQKESTAVSSMVGNMRNSLSKVMHETSNSEEEQARELSAAGEDMARASESSGKQIAEMQGAEADLGVEAKNYQNAMTVAEDELQSTLALPMQENSPQNRQYAQNMDNLHRKITDLMATSSLLQKGASITKQSTADQEVAALESLNAQLRKENKALAEEDSRLDSRVAGIKAQLHAAGLKV